MPVYIGKSGDLVGWHRCLTHWLTHRQQNIGLLSFSTVSSLSWVTQLVVKKSKFHPPNSGCQRTKIVVLFWKRLFLVFGWYFFPVPFTDNSFWPERKRNCRDIQRGITLVFIMTVWLNTLLLEVLVSYWSPRYSSQYLLCDTIHQLGWTQLPRGFWNSLASPEENCCTQHLTSGKTPEAPWSRAPLSLQHQVPPQSPGGAPDKPVEREPGSSLHLHAGVGNQLAGASPGDQVRAAHKGDRGSHLGHPVTLAEPHFRSAPFNRQSLQRYTGMVQSSSICVTCWTSLSEQGQQGRLHRKSAWILLFTTT